VRVGFLGPAGTHSDEALRASAPALARTAGAAPGLDAGAAHPAPAGALEQVPFPTVYETVMAVQAREVDRAVVPIENSLEGGVAATLDALAGEADRVRIAGELVHPVHHCLVAARELDLTEVSRLVSHPQASAQCARFLATRLPGVERVAAPSTADAVRQVSESSEPWAALGSRLSAELYGCRLLTADVEDRPDNLTRFVWLAPADEAAAPGRPAKTSVVFWGAGDQAPGWLVGVLQELAERGVNLTRIESRPRRERLGHYMFFADLEGARDDPPVRDALAALGARVETLKVLGSYTAAATLADDRGR
jgi:prephenate dehydratase